MKWIKADEQLPTKDCETLIYDRYGLVSCDNFILDRWSWQNNDDVTHWAEMPSPPEASALVDD